MDIIVKPKQITKFIVFIVIFLTFAHITGQWASLYFELEGEHKPIVVWFDLDEELNFPSYYSTVSLLFCSSLLAVITFAKRKNKERYLYWFGLAVIFLFLSMDESIGLHESLKSKVQIALNTSKSFYSAWVIPYSIALIIFLLVYVKFVFNLPSKTRILFLIAGLVYVVGALGMEIIGEFYSKLHADNITLVIMLTTIEELLEMTGIVIFIYTLMSYIDSELKDLRLSIKSS
ncbi:MAG: hypothetical protein ACUZ9M_04980 [Candidatus Scalindua sp.]